MDVFIVDDDPGALNSLRFLLESDGLRVSAFRSGQELLAELPRANPDCVIIDFKMPAMDGLDVYRNLRQLNDAVPVILVTGHPDPSIRVKAERAGLELIEKPLSQDVLLLAIRAAREKRPRPGSIAEQ
mgnify:CR=1 FL=1|jgi:FixJ family two-component response regulator